MSTRTERIKKCIEQWPSKPQDSKNWMFGSNAHQECVKQQKIAADQENLAIKDMIDALKAWQGSAAAYESNMKDQLAALGLKDTKGQAQWTVGALCVYDWNIYLLKRATCDMLHLETDKWRNAVIATA